MKRSLGYLPGFDVLGLLLLAIAFTGHWILEESPKDTTDALVKFL